MKRTNALLLTLSLLVCPPTFVGAHNPFNITPELDKSIREGLHHLYNLEFEEADQIFKDLEPQAAEHPMVAFGKASVHWWRLSVYVLETDPLESQPFLRDVNECIRLSKEKIDRGDPTGEGYLTLGGAYGLLGRWQATNQEWMAAYFTGRKAIKFLRKALKVNPRMTDANMGLGIFDYYVATLPAVVRVLAFLGSGGNPQVGIDELTIAATQGTYAQTPSKLFLTEIYSNPENQPEKALRILVGLKQEYPTSPFIEMLHIIALYNHQRLDELASEAKHFQEMVDKGTFKSQFAVQSRFALGAVNFKSRQWDQAILNFDLAIESGTIKDPFFTWAHLYKGYALDALKQREAAKTQYQTVLKQLRRWGSWDAAKKHLKKPFPAKDEDLAKLRL
ncbi:MAG: hypothetical protein KCHDKBKB_02097 [Elusimicrobia bacterium]|nr:hypothetical protein [Elusimicrobiota bacterium]